MRSKENRFLTPASLIGLGAVAGVLTGFVWLTFWWRGNAARATVSWLPVPCVITRSAVRETITAHQAGTTRRYDVEVSFRYTVGGQELSGNRYAMVRPSLLKYVAEDIVARLPAGSETICYYNPAQPEESVVVRGDPVGDGGTEMMIAGVGFAMSLVLLGVGVVAKLRGP